MTPRALEGTPPARVRAETVRNYPSAAITKTGTRNRLEALRVVDERGWV